MVSIIIRALAKQLTRLNLIQVAAVYYSTSCLLLCFPTNAQVNPPLPLPNPSRQEEPEILPELPQVIPTPETSDSPILLSPDSIPGKIIIRKFNIVGNRVLPSTEIDRVVKPYLFRPISFIELLEVQTAITQLYIDKGYITSGAFIPPQIIEDRTIQVEIVEGTVEAIKISGLNRLKESYIRSRLAIATTPPLNQDRLLKALQLLQVNPLIANISAELSEGVNPGSSFLEVDIKEADSREIALSIDNYRSPSVGTMRRQIELNEQNLLGWGDRFHVSYINTDGSNSLDNLSYTLPLNPHNGEIELVHSRTYSEIIEAPFDDLDIETNIHRYDLTYRQPLLQTPKRTATIGLTFSRQDSENTLMDSPFPLSRGADRRGKTKISALRFFQEYTTRDRQQVFAARSEFSIGIDAFNATINSNLPDSKFVIWRGQAQYLRLLTPNINLLLKSNVQLANDSLVALEQFSAGGGLNVRGYRQDVLLGDNGLFLTAELRNTVLQIDEWDLSLELIPFIDFAKAWNSDNVTINQNNLASLGLGLQLSISDRLNARVDWGLPLIDIDSEGDSLQENGVHFSLELKPF